MVEHERVQRTEKAEEEQRCGQAEGGEGGRVVAAALDDPERKVQREKLRQDPRVMMIHQ